MVGVLFIMLIKYYTIHIYFTFSIHFFIVILLFCYCIIALSNHITLYYIRLDYITVFDEFLKIKNCREMGVNRR